MPKLSYLRCRRCHELLQNREEAYCAPCNLYLCYEAMPLLLWMLMLGHIRMTPRRAVPLYDTGLVGYEKSDAVCWE